MHASWFVYSSEQLGQTNLTPSALFHSTSSPSLVVLPKFLNLFSNLISTKKQYLLIIHIKGGLIACRSTKRGLHTAMAAIRNVLLYATIFWATSCCLGFRLRDPAAEDDMLAAVTEESEMCKHTHMYCICMRTDTISITRMF